MNRGNAVAANRIGSSVTMGNTARGQGIFPNGSANTNVVAWSAPNIGTPLSMEVLFFSGSSITSKTLIGYNDVNTGSSTTFDKTIAFNALSQLTAYVFDGGEKPVTDSTTTFATNTFYHAVMTLDGTTLRLYVNGVQTATTGAIGSYTGYAAPYFNVGATYGYGTAAITPNCVATILLANVANACWTPAEVMGRYLDPFGFLDYPDDDLFSEIAGPSVVGKSPRVRRVTFFY